MGRATVHAKTERCGVVLVVEDNPLLQLTTMEVLAGSGLDVIPANNADEALCILESRDDVRAVFTDIEMPGSMDGLGLVETVCARWPEICAVVTSGGPPPKRWPLPSHVRYYQKPYNQRSLIEALGG